MNLSAATLADAGALQRIHALLSQHAGLGSRLTLEIGEEQLPEQQVLEQLTRRLHALGFGLALQRFGGRFSMIGNLAHLGLAYLKIDGSYIRNIDQEQHKRLFIEAVQRAAHSIDLPLIAERVETEGELQVLREMGIQGVQGNCRRTCALEMNTNGIGWPVFAGQPNVLKFRLTHLPHLPRSGCSSCPMPCAPKSD